MPHVTFLNYLVVCIKIVKLKKSLNSKKTNCLAISFPQNEVSPHRILGIQNDALSANTKSRVFTVHCFFNTKKDKMIGVLIKR